MDSLDILAVTFIGLAAAILTSTAIVGNTQCHLVTAGSTVA